MPQIIEKTIYAHVSASEYGQNGIAFHWLEHESKPYKGKPSHWGTYIGKATVQIELADGVDLRLIAAAQLDATKKEVMAELQAKITQIDAQKQKLLALEASP